ncbi:hypothetical protein JCM8115_001576 [Rhodotorula mucilaginosa]
MVSATTPAQVAATSQPSSAQYFETEDKLIISIDIGNAASSVTLAHLTWGSDPLSSAPTAKPCIRTVLTYPHCSPHLGASTSARVPSLIAFDRDDKAQAFGAECLTEDVQNLVRRGEWLLVQGWKEQMRPIEATSSLSRPRESSKKKLLTKLHRSTVWPENSSPKSGHSLHPTTTNLSSRTVGTVSSYSTSSDALLDARSEVAPAPSHPTSPRRVAGLDGGTGALGEFAMGPTVRKNRKDAAAAASRTNEAKSERYPGPRLRTVYAEFLRYLVAAARAWYAESVPQGEATFVRLWSTCIFVLTTPSDWSPGETDLLRQAVEDAKLLPVEFEIGRLFFVKEPIGIVHFAKRYISDTSWCREGKSFALIDAASAGTTVVGYHVTAISPRLKVRAYDTARLAVGAENVLDAFRRLLETRLARTKFKSSSVVLHLAQEFRDKVLPVFSGDTGVDFRLRIHGKDDGTKEWERLERAMDSGCRIRDGVMTLSTADVEDCFRAVADEIVVRLSSILSRGEVQHVLLVGGFGDSFYLARRIQGAFAKDGVSLLRPEVPAPAAISEGAMRLYLAETLVPRYARHALGVETAVDWSTAWRPGMENRQILSGSGGTRLIRGKFTPIVHEGDEIRGDRTWSRPFNLKYRFSAGEPIFEAALYRRDSDCSSMPDGEDWLRDENDSLNPAFQHAGTVAADLSLLVASLPVFEANNPEKAWVQLDLRLSVYVGEASLEACVVWRDQSGEHSGPPLRLQQILI